MTQESTESDRVLSGRHHPLNGIANASHIRSVLTGACCEYGDGSGKFDAQAARGLLEGFHPSMIADALTASDLDSLMWFGRALWHFFDGLKPDFTPGLVEMRAALSKELKAKLTTTSEPRSLAYAVNLECFQHPSGSGSIDLAATRRLFDGFTASQFATTLSTGKRSDLAYLSSSLDALAGATSVQPCDGLEQLRLAVNETLCRNLSEAQQRLALAADADAAIECMTRVCCLNDHNLEQIDAKSAQQLFQALDVGRIRQMLSASSGPSVSKLARLLKNVSQAVTPPSEEVEALVNATNHALKMWIGIIREELAQAFDVKALVDVVAVACCEYSDGSGQLNEPAVRMVFDGLSAELFVRSLRASDLDACLKMRTVFGRIHTTLQRKNALPCAGLEQALAATALGVRENLAFAGDIDSLRTAICTVCCEYSDASGKTYADQTRALFDGLAVERFRDVLSKSDAPSRQKLAGILQKLALTVGYPRCEGLEAFRRAVSGDVE